MKSLICRFRGHDWELRTDVGAASVGGVHQECRRCAKNRVTYQVKDREVEATRVLGGQMWHPRW